jgi:hypothetical protein
MTVRPNHDNLIEKSAEICGNSHESSETGKCRVLQIFGKHFEQEHHSLQMANHFALL